MPDSGTGAGTAIKSSNPYDDNVMNDLTPAEMAMIFGDSY